MISALALVALAAAALMLGPIDPTARRRRASK